MKAMHSFFREKVEKNTMDILSYARLKFSNRFFPELLSGVSLSSMSTTPASATFPITVLMVLETIISVMKSMSIDSTEFIKLS